MTEHRFAPGAFDAADWDRAAGGFRDFGLPQSWAYGEARAAEPGWRVERGTIADGGRILAAAQVLVRSLPVVGGGLAWVGRGPLWRRDNGPAGTEGLAAILAALRRHYVAGRGFYLRIAPPVAVGSPEGAAFAAAGFRDTGVPGWASAALDLTRDLAALRAGLAQKWRNGLNKAERLGVSVARGEGGAALEAFVAEYRGFVAARGFATTVTPDLLAALDRALPERRRLVVFRASHEGSPLGSALIARYGDACEYLAGTLLEAGRGYNAGQILLWRAVEEMKAEGLARFDLGGMDPVLTPKGIYDFKLGLGGVPYRYADEIEADDSGWRARLVRWRVGRARAAAADAAEARP